MKKIITSVALIFSAAVSYGQTTAQDFNRPDCNGIQRHLFASLDSGKVAILEYYMGPSCSPCINTAHELSALQASLLAAHPGKVDYYAIGYQNSYTCAAIKSWVTANAPTAIPLDSGAVDVAYYGGFSMPSVIVVAGSAHKIIFAANATTGGYNVGDTFNIRTKVNQFFNAVSVPGVSVSNGVKVYPNPASEMLNVELTVEDKTKLSVELVDLVGRVVTAQEAEDVSGAHRTTINTQGLPAGSYLVRVKTNSGTAIQKVSITR